MIAQWLSANTMGRDWLGVLWGLGVGVAVWGLSGVSHSPTMAQTLPVRVDRWLEVYSFRGPVTWLRQQQVRPARVGQRLSRVGDGLQTGQDAGAILSVDTQIGFVVLSDNTRLRIENMEALPSGGRVTELFVERGQARLQPRPFTNPDTRFDLRTPAGTTSVRGTVYGVAVQPTGRTGVATETGAVAVSAAGETVTVNAGFQSQVVPGSPPTPPQPLTNDLRLDLRVLKSIGPNRVLIEGRIDPVNLLLIRDQVQTVRPDGSFRRELSVATDQPIPAMVVTPLGQKQAYEIQAP